MEPLQPPPLYAPLVARPLILEDNDFYKSELNIKKCIRTSMKDSFYFIEPTKSETSDFHSNIERYSDRYTKLKKASINDWQPVWDRLPKELKSIYTQDEKSKVKKRKSNATPNLVKRKIKREIDIDTLDEIIARDDDKDENEENEDNEDENQKEKRSEKGSDDEENQDELEADEEEVEEENDYIDTYFDNGENYGDDDMGGGDDEGPTY